MGLPKQTTDQIRKEAEELYQYAKGNDDAARKWNERVEVARKAHIYSATQYAGVLQDAMELLQTIVENASPSPEPNEYYLHQQSLDRAKEILSATATLESFNQNKVK